MEETENKLTRIFSGSNGTELNTVGSNDNLIHEIESLFQTSTITIARLPELSLGSPIGPAVLKTIHLSVPNITQRSSRPEIACFFLQTFFAYCRLLGNNLATK